MQTSAEGLHHRHDQRNPEVVADFNFGDAELRVVSKELTDGSRTYDVHWSSSIDSIIVIECVDKASAMALAKAIESHASDFDIAQA